MKCIRRSAVNRLPRAVRNPIFGVAAGLILAATIPASAQPLKDITIGLSSGSLTVGSVRIAKEMGVYEKHGLNPKFVVMDSGNAALTGLIGGSFEAVVATAGDIVAAQGRGQKLVSIGSVYDGLGATLVLAKSVADKLNVSPTAPVGDRFKALEGLMIALPSPTANYTLSFRIAAQANGVNIRSTYVPAANMPAALESGAVQGFFTSAPFWPAAVVKGSAVVWLSGPKGDFPLEATPATAATIQMTRSFAESNPDTVKALVAALDDFARAVDQRPAEVRAAAGKVFPGIDAATIDLFLSYEAAAWKTRPFTAKEMARDIAFVKASGIPVPGIDDLDPASMIYPAK